MPVEPAINDFMAAREIERVAGLLVQLSLARAGRSAENEGLTVREFARAAGISKSHAARAIQMRPSLAVPAQTRALLDELIKLGSRMQSAPGTDPLAP